MLNVFKRAIARLPVTDQAPAAPASLAVDEARIAGATAVSVAIAPDPLRVRVAPPTQNTQQLWWQCTQCHRWGARTVTSPTGAAGLDDAVADAVAELRHDHDHDAQAQ